MRRTRRAALGRWAGTAGLLGAGLVAGCAPGREANRETSAVQIRDPKQIAASLVTKTQTLITAINEKNSAAIAKAKADLEPELDRADEALKSDASKEAGQVTTGISNIRLAMLVNDVARLERGRDQLKQVTG